MYFEQGDAAWRSSRCHWKYQLATSKVTRKNRNGGKWALWTTWRDRPWREYSSEGTTKRAFGRISWYRSLDLQVDRRRPCHHGKAANPQIFVDPFDLKILRFSFWNTIALRLSFSEEFYTIPITHLVVVERNVTLRYLLRYCIRSFLLAWNRFRMRNPLSLRGIIRFLTDLVWFWHLPGVRVKCNAIERQGRWREVFQTF